MPDPRRLIRPVTGPVHYHCISRVVDRRFVFSDHERDIFRRIMRQVEAFSGVRVITWTMLSNHFHLLLEVPPPPAEAPGDDEILDRCRKLYSSRAMADIEWDFENARRLGTAALDTLRMKYLRRMWDLSEFMKTLKQKFTIWFNTKHGREGTLWERRFKSLLVEGEWGCLLKVAAYIDLNPVRAGLVDDPKDYPWCGYGEASAGNREARRGLAATLSHLKAQPDWRDVAPRYRKILFGISGNPGAPEGLSQEEIATAWQGGGKLSLPQLLRCRVRYLTDGVAIGREAFVEQVFRSLRSTFSRGRDSGARRMTGGEWGDLRTLRALRVDPISLGGDG